MSKTKHLISSWLRRFGKQSFIKKLSPRATILDVGCGGSQVLVVKTFQPHCRYIGIDIQDFRQSDEAKLAMDEYLIVNPDEFPDSIKNLGQQFDAVICAHNLEHVNDRNGTLAAMFNVVKPGGRIYLSFPTEKSVDFPKRGKGLNYYADKTHKDLPPNFDEVVSKLRDSGFTIDFASRRYRPIILFLVGLSLEPYSRIKQRTQIGTWELYGFEAVINATKVLAKPNRS